MRRERRESRDARDDGRKRACLRQRRGRRMAAGEMEIGKTREGQPRDGRRGLR
jgi:hypothetical protein